MSAAGVAASIRTGVLNRSLQWRMSWRLVAASITHPVFRLAGWLADDMLPRRACGPADTRLAALNHCSCCITQPALAARRNQSYRRLLCIGWRRLASFGCVRGWRRRRPVRAAAAAMYRGGVPAASAIVLGINAFAAGGSAAARQISASKYGCHSLASSTAEARLG